MSRKLDSSTMKAVVPRGMHKRIPQEQIDEALDRLAHGEEMIDVTADMGITRSALFKRCHDDPEFEKLFYAALRIGSWGKLAEAVNGIKGGQYSTGDFQRDKELLAYAKWYAARINRERFGDKVEIETQQVVVNVPSWSGGLLQRVTPAIPAPDIVLPGPDERGDGDAE